MANVFSFGRSAPSRLGHLRFEHTGEHIVYTCVHPDEGMKKGSL